MPADCWRRDSHPPSDLMTPTREAAAEPTYRQSLDLSQPPFVFRLAYQEAVRCCSSAAFRLRPSVSVRLSPNARSFQQQSGVRNRISIRVRTIQHFHAALLLALLLTRQGERENHLPIVRRQSDLPAIFTGWAGLC